MKVALTTLGCKLNYAETSTYERGFVAHGLEVVPWNAVADPGALLVALCHRNGIEVVPLVGPSSLMLALMASGLNGQSFAFAGYIPAKTEERRAAIRRLEKRSAAEHQTQIIIETPYRNDALLADLASTCSGRTLITVAANITQPDAYIRTLPAARWKEHPVTIGKRPCVFLILA